MGSLHAGHLSLVAEARKLAGARGKVVVSIYVNPTQFGPKEDFSKYPRDLTGDVNLCRSAGTDVIFAPRDEEMYPRARPDGFSTFVDEELLSQGMEGASRPGHFRGVATIVAKLFNLVQPDFAIFGAKDFQQAAVIRRMVRDLNFPLKIRVAPTVREPDGLAMSSRNRYLTGDLRGQASVLARAIQRVRARVRKSSRAVPASRLQSEVRRLVQNEPDARLDYATFFDPETLVPLKSARRGAQMAMAVRIGATRLIDNARL
jgi:pantoate--beta-alanine ligase